MTAYPSPDKRYRITLLDFTLAFVPFAVMMSAALLAAELSLDLIRYRTIYTIWVTTALFTPAMAAFVLPADSVRRRSLWLIFWSFSYLAFLIHTAYAYFGFYGGSFQRFLDGQGLFPAIVNIVFFVWWTFDLLLALCYHGDARWVRRERGAAHVFIFLTFFSSTVILNDGFVRILGIVMTLIIAVCLLVRLDRRCASPAKRATP